MFRTKNVNFKNSKQEKKLLTHTVPGSLKCVTPLVWWLMPFGCWKRARGEWGQNVMVMMMTMTGQPSLSYFRTKKDDYQTLSLSLTQKYTQYADSSWYSGLNGLRLMCSRYILLNKCRLIRHGAAWGSYTIPYYTHIPTVHILYCVLTKMEGVRFYFFTSTPL